MTNMLIFDTNMIKSRTNHGYAGSGILWCIKYCLLYCISKGLIGVPTSVMSRRSVLLGIKYIDHMFALPFEKKYKYPHQIAETAISKL